MAIFEVNRAPDDRTLRQFAVAAAAIVALLTWGLTRSPSVAAVAASFGAVACVTTWRRPQFWKRTFVSLSFATAPIGIVVGELLLATMFFGVFLPIGLVFKLLGRDPLERGIRRESVSYWSVKRSSRADASYFRQF